MVVKVEGVVVKRDSSDLQKHPPHQHPYHPLEITFGLLVGGHGDEAGVECDFDSSTRTN